MKLHFFGTCAGTEPMPERHHTSFAAELNGSLYWFDAGENCSYTAHLMGLDLRKIRAIFISHTHMDHIGGLGNLLWNIRKLTTLDGRQPEWDIELIIPNLESYNAVIALLKNTEGGFKTKFSINPHEARDGEVYRDENISVEALHNHHLPRNGDEPWRSFSYRFKGDGKVVIFSGDVKSTSDMDAFLADGCDLLLTETGHHSPEVAAGYIAERGYDVRRLGYIHSGRAILESRENALKLIGAVRREPYFICEDRQSLEL